MGYAYVSIISMPTYTVFNAQVSKTVCSYAQASSSLIPTDWLRLRAAQVPRCRDLAIFVVTTTDRQVDR